MPTLQVLIAGVDRTDFIKRDTVRISLGLREVTRCTFQIEELWRGLRPVKGTIVQVKVDGDTRFAGPIQLLHETSHPATQLPGGTSAALKFDVTCVDYTQILCDRLVTSSYEGETLWDIVNHINTVFLAGEGITITGVQNPGPTIAGRLVFDHVTAFEALNTLSTETGLFWYLDFAKDLQFDDFSAVFCPFSLTGTSGNWSDIEITHDDSTYLNRITERGAVPYAQEMTETIIATEDQMQFPTQAVIAQLRFVSVNGVTKTFVPVDFPNASWPAPGSAGFDFSYFGNMPSEEFDAVVWTDIAAGDVVVVKYLPYLAPNPDGSPQGPNTVTVNDTAEQAARAALTGGSGIVERFETQDRISDVNALTDIANGRIRQWARDVKTLKVTVWEDGAQPGQFLPVDVPWHDVDEDFLIEHVEAEWMTRADGDRFKYTVDGTSAEPSGRPIDLLASMLRSSAGGNVGGAAGTALARPTVNGSINPTVPPLSGFTWVNQGDAKASEAEGGIRLVGTSQQGDQIRLLYKAAPATPYRLTAGFIASVSQETGRCRVGIGWRESSSGKLHLLCAHLFSVPSDKGLTSTKFDSPTSYNTHYKMLGGTFGINTWSDHLCRLQIEDNGVNRICRYSNDGVHWVDFDTQGRTDFLTADEILFFVGSNQTPSIIPAMWLLNWKVEAL